MNWAPTDRALAHLAVAVLHSALADQDHAFVHGPYASGFCQLAGLSLTRYRAAYVLRSLQVPEVAASA
jgi:hypothetical protein